MNFYEQENNKTVLKTREIIRELPEFCNEFFLDLNQNTLPKTRMGYAYDLRVFFNFLVTENKEFLGRDIKSLTLDDLQKIFEKTIIKVNEKVSLYNPYELINPVNLRNLFFNF